MYNVRSNKQQRILRGRPSFTVHENDVQYYYRQISFKNGCVLVHIFSRRCEEQVRELQSSQQAISMELEGKQAHCQELRTSLEEVLPQVERVEEAKKQVHALHMYSAEVTNLPVLSLT